MQCNDQAASLSLRAALRHKCPGRAVHINGGAIVVGAKLVLVELDETAAERPGMTGIQVAIEHGQERLFRVNAAVVDERRGQHRTGSRGVG